LQGKIYELNDPINIYALGSSFFMKSLRYLLIRSILFSVLRIGIRARKLRNILKSEGVSQLVICSGDFENLPAGYIASRMARVSFSLYYFDWYGMQWPSTIRRRLALWIEKRIINGASSIIVPNQSLQEEIELYYGVHPIVIHNPSSEDSFDQGPRKVWPTYADDIRIIYTGAIYHAQMDAFMNLCHALGELSETNLSLHVYSAQDSSKLDLDGPLENITFHPHVPPEKATEIQREADILFLPLAFTSRIQEVLKTSAPGKMGEYLVSGRPILVHAPEDSFICRYFNKYECGSVVSENSPSKLLLGIQRIVDDEGFRHRIVRNALGRANIDYHPGVARERFRKVISSNL